MKRRVFIIILAAVLCMAAAASAVELTFSQTCKHKLSRATQLYVDPEGNGELMPSTMLQAGTYVIPNGTSLGGMTGISYSSNDRNVLYGYVEGSAIVSAVQTITLPSGRKVTVGEALVRSRTALNLWLEMEYGENLSGSSTYVDDEGNEHEIGNENALEDEKALDGDAEWARAVGAAYTANGADVRTVYTDDEGNETRVEVRYMGLTRSMVVMNGEEQLVETWRLSWDTHASADKVLAVVKADTSTVRLREKAYTRSTVLERVKCNRVVQVVRYGKHFSLVDINVEGVPLGYISTSSLDFYPNSPMQYQSAKITINGRTNAYGDPVGIRARDEKGSSNNWKVDSFSVGYPLSVYAQNESWSEVDVGGYHAYILNEFVTLDSEAGAE